LDIQYGNVWTNIPDSLFNQFKPKYGEVFHTVISHNGKPVYTVDAPYCQTFGAVAKGKPLVYLNSLLQYSLALNQGSFAGTNHIGSGSGWSVAVSKK
jgi:S-adenosylmethionine hydrolase